MIRPFTALCVLLAGSSGLYLYTEKHRTTVLDQQISKLVQDTQHVREHTAMIRAEWALLNQPDRLAALAAHFLPGLQPMAPTQFVQLASLAQHLPAIPAATPTPAPAPVQAPAPAPLLASGMAPREVMARTLVTLDARPERQAMWRSPIRIAQGENVAANEGAKMVLHTLAARQHTPIRLAAPRPASPRMAGLPHPDHQRTIQASRMAAYMGTPTQAAWHPAYTASDALRNGSVLGFAHASLPAPVPMKDNE